MDIRVSGHQIDTGNALKTHVSTRLQGTVDKYFPRALSAHATFRPAPHGAFHCDIVCHVMSGLILKGQGEAQDAHIACDQAAERIDKQLRRYMRRLKDRHEQSAAAELQRDLGTARVAPNGIEDASYTVFQGHEDEEEGAPDAPVVVAEMRVDIPHASVSDAVMMLDLRNTNALMFVNSKTSAFNMVYRRNDGTIGWVEPPRG
ncbi:MAG: ribosome-associated translation inhibitor RaiA [Sphingobium sp.]|nr:ribosome-associated translation inhibitor RaiA [Sphingobium sp.]